MTTKYSVGVIDFVSENQSIIDGVGDLTGSADAAFSFYDYSRLDLYDGTYTQSGADLRGEVSGRFGFGVDYGIYGFAVDSAITTNPWAQFPDNYRVGADESVRVYTQENVSDVRFSTDGLDFEFNISLIADMDFYVRLYAGLFGQNTQLIIREGFDERIELLSVDSGGLELFNLSNFTDTDGDAQFAVDMWDLLSGLFGVPGETVEIEDSEVILVGLEPELAGDLGSIAVDLSGDEISASSTSGAINDDSTDKLVDVDLDLLALLTLVGFPPLSFEYELEIGDTFEVSLLGASIGPTIEFDREVTLTPELGVTLDFSEAVVIDGKEVSTWTGAWDDFPVFNLVEDHTTVTPTFQQWATFETDLDLGINMEGTFSALEASYDGAGVDVGIGPLYERDSTSRIKTVELYDSTFGLGGFDTFVGMPITIVSDAGYRNPGVDDGIADAPEATDDAFRIFETEVLELTARDLFGNDFDPDPLDVFTIDVYALDDDGEPITLGALSQVHYTADSDDGYSSAVPGSLSTITYDPRLNFYALNDFETGYDTFGYTITDSAGLQDTGTVTIEIDGVTNPAHDTFSFDPATVLTGDLFADNGFGADPDGFGEIASIDGLPIVSGDAFTLPSGAILTVHEDGRFTYDATGLDLSLMQSDSFYYTANSPNGRFWLGDRDGTNRFKIVDEFEGGSLGHAVSSAGDFNGDGWTDILISAPTVDFSTEQPSNDYSDYTIDIGLFSGPTESGVTYVLYGSEEGFDPIQDLSTFDAARGLKLVGEASSFSGMHIDSAGDVNGDGLDDIIIGGPQLDLQPDNPFGGAGGGRAYVVYGSAANDRAVLNLSALTAAEGFYFEWNDLNAGVGVDVAGAGDINRDGYDDVLIAAEGPAFFGGNDGVIYAVMGGPDLQGELTPDDLGGSAGFKMTGMGYTFDTTSANVPVASGIGDFNGDQIDDIIVGGPGAPPPGISFVDGALVINDDPPENKGYSFILYGKAHEDGNFASTTSVDTLSASKGFAIVGGDEGSGVGLTVSGAGDINGDQLADVIVSKPAAGEDAEGAAYIVFGQSGNTSSSLDITDLNGSNGFTIVGAQDDGGIGFSVSALGDVNGDQFDDLIVGAPFVDPESGTDAGVSYVIFGTASGFDATINVADLDGLNGVRFEGAERSDMAGMAVSALGDINKDGFDDIIIGGPGSQISSTSNASGAGYVVYGPFEFEPGLVSIDFIDTTAPVIVDHSLSYSENRFEGAVVGRITTDELFTVTAFEIVGGNDDGYFAIDHDGLVTLTAAGAAGAANDFESGSNSFVLDVTATDNSGNTSDVTSLTVDVTDVMAAVDDRLEADESTGVWGALFDDNGSGEDGADQRVLAYVEGGAVASGEAITLPSGALLRVYNSGVFDYDPNGAVFSGATDSFTYATYSDSVLVDQISLDDMDASQGFTMWGPEVGGLTGQSVSVVGDVNGDGYADVMIGAPYADTTDMAGDAYLVYGSADGPGTDIALSDLDGTHGVRLTGMSVSERFGIAVAGLGDINGDGYDDFAVGATYGDFDDGSSSRTSGEMYVVFGKNGSFGSEFDVTTLDGTDGFAVHSLTGGNALGVSAASAGDLNGDGLDDILIGAPRAASRDGLAYVIYGQETAYSADIDPNALDGAQGFVISGADDDGVIGASVAALGDVNGDGLNDFVVGAAHADVDGQNKAGAAYVVFGNGLGFDDVNLADLDGSNGFRLTGGHAEDRAGQAVSSAGDINGDGLQDILVGAPRSDPNSVSTAGTAYVVFGQSGGYEAELSVLDLDGTNGFALEGMDKYGYLGTAVAGVGDFNGDGFDDIAVGAPETTEGQVYLLYGAAGGWLDAVDLSRLNGDQGLLLEGGAAGESYAGEALSGGDVNGDGYDDIVIGAPGADAQGQGAVHVLYGGPQPVSDTATVTIDVVFDDLTLKPDAFTVLATDVLTGNVFDDNGSGADGTPDGTSFRVVDVNTDTDVVGTQHTLASGAVLTVNADGTFAYDPGSAFVSLGADETFTETFTYAAPSDKAFAPSLSGDFVADGAGLHFTGAAEGDSLGNAVSVLGDINGDGLDDVAFAAPMADGEDGEVYVVFGSSEGLESALTPADLDGTNGFVITSKGAGDHTGYSVSGIGDFNDDGIDDFAIGAPFADRGVSTDRGEIHIVFGRDTVPTDAVPTPEGFEANLNVASLDGTYGFEIVGASRNSQSGYDISGGGDINADGIADLIVGVRYGSKSGQTKSGDTYVIFGTSDAQTVDMRLSEIDGSNGFRVEGVDSRDRSGSVVASLGDFNGDGFDDFVIGAPLADPEGTSSGEAYIVFGFDDTAVGAFSADDLDGTNGFRFVGEDAYDRTGFAVSAAGDLNNDGLADVAIGARTADDGGTNSGSTYIIYGREAAMPATRRPEHLNGQLGTLIKGDNNDDESGYAVASAGDLNSDGIDDLIIGARGADIRGSWSSLVQDYDVGAAIVVYGQDGGLGSSVNISHLDDDAGFILYGRDEYENMGYAVGGAGDINGDGIHDIVLGAPLSDTVATNSGAAYVLFGPERITTDVTITVQGVNDAPVLDLAAALEIDENLTSIDLLEITDVDGDVIVVELTGEDADLFDVHAEDSIVDTSGAKATSAFKLSWEGGAAFDAGEPGGGLPPVGPPEGPGGGAPTSDRRELVFRDAPNFEAPQDADGDGYYDITLTATDGTTTISQDVRIKVRDVNDLPHLIDDRYSVEAGETVSGNVLTEHGLDTDEDGDTLTVVAILGDQTAIGQPYRLPSGALITLQSDGAFVYDPDGAFAPQPGEASPRDALTYTVADGRGGTSIAKMIIAATLDGIERGSDEGEGLSGGPFDSHIFGAGGDDFINGDGGDDTLEGGDGHDRINGGDWNDVLSGQAGNDSLNGNANEDVLFGDAGDDHLDGGAGRDTLDGGAGRDKLNGGADDDRLIARAQDTVDGGEGDDLLALAHLASGGPDSYRVVVDMSLGRAENHDGVGVVEFTGIEGIEGSDFSDLIRGSDADEAVYGLAGADWIKATAGADIYDGGRHKDMVAFDAWTGGAHPVHGVFDFDGAAPVGVALAGIMVDLADGTHNTGLAAGKTLIGIERVTGTSFQDVLAGDEGANDLRGLGGNDWFIATDGGQDRYFGGSGSDTVTYHHADSAVVVRLDAVADGGDANLGWAEDDTFVFVENLVGSAFGDELHGDTARNVLIGLEGDDFIFGSNGRDTLSGGLGDDTLSGGAGADTAVFDGARADYVVIRTGNKTVKVKHDTDGVDVLRSIEYLEFDDMVVDVWALAIA